MCLRIGDVEDVPLENHQWQKQRCLPSPLSAAGFNKGQLSFNKFIAGIFLWSQLKDVLTYVVAMYNAHPIILIKIGSDFTTLTIGV